MGNPDQHKPDPREDTQNRTQDQSQRQPGREHPTVADESMPQNPNDRARESDLGQDKGNNTRRDEQDKVRRPKDPRPIVQSPQDDLA